MSRKILFLLLLAAILLAGNFLLPRGGTTLSYDNGAAGSAGQHDIKNSPYFAQPDIYNLTSNDHLTVLSHFRTKQQIKNYSCGPVAAAMVVEYLKGRDLHSEEEIAHIMGTSPTKGTDTRGMTRYFHELGWQVESSLETGSPKSYREFQLFVKAHLQAGTPIMVENVDWGGHWRVIIGYDTMGTVYGSDDVLLMADPFDTTDHLQDGYNVVSAQRFYSMWFDDHLFPAESRPKQWLAARPGN